MNVLSLFDGMSCGQIALNRLGTPPTKYYAAEIDTHAIKVTQANHPNTVQLGSVESWREWPIDWASIDLLIGGSPCQGFSFAGKQLAFDDPRSKLFFVYVDILNHIRSVNPKVNFLLENVKMKKEHLNLISQFLGVEPVFINSALISAQNRQRFYWCNWHVEQPGDRGIMLADILETEGVGCIKNLGKFIPRTDKSQCLDANYHKGVDNHGQRTMIAGAEIRTRGFETIKIPGKSYALTASGHSGGKNLVALSMLPRGNNPGGLHALDGKTPSLTSNSWEHNFKLTDGHYYRKLTPIECERLQTVPDNYTNHVSNTQRYRMLGNGWTVEVIIHLLRCRLYWNMLHASN